MTKRKLTEDVESESRIRELEATNRRLLRALADKDRKRAELEEVIYQAAHDAYIAVGKPAIVAPPIDGRKVREEVALLHLTDWQDGKVTASFNMEVVERRVMETVRKTIKLTKIQRADHPVHKIRVLLGGDMAEGVTIYPGQAHEVEAGAFEQVFHCANLITSALLSLSQAFEQVEVDWVTGNHGRIARRGDHPRGDNLDRFIYRIAKLGTELDNSIRWNETYSWYTNVVIGNYTAMLVHGDQVGVAAKTIMDKVAGWQSGVVEQFTDCYIGHRHHNKVLTLPSGGSVFLTPSIESGSEYAREKMGVSGMPAQRLNFIDPEKGRVTAEYRIDLTGV